MNSKSLSKRTDIHCPSQINPTEYQFVGFDYVPVDDIGAAMFLQSEREAIRLHMAQTLGTYSSHSHAGNCMVCGSVNAIYTVLFYHELTNVYVRMGNDCAQKCDVAFSNGDFDAFKSKIGNAREAVAGKKKAAAFLVEAGMGFAWELYNSTEYNTFRFEEDTIRDIVGKLVQYGNLTDKQLKFVGTLLSQIQNRNQIAAEREAQKAAAAPLPNFSGRVQVEGTILSKKGKDTRFGFVVKIVVQHVDGWKVYGTLPASLEKAEKGDSVSFMATVKISPDDSKFGFFSRPTNGTILHSSVDTDVAA